MHKTLLPSASPGEEGRTFALHRSLLPSASHGRVGKACALHRTLLPSASPGRDIRGAKGSLLRFANSGESGGVGIANKAYYLITLLPTLLLPLNVFFLGLFLVLFEDTGHIW